MPLTLLNKLFLLWGAVITVAQIASGVLAYQAHDHHAVPQLASVVQPAK